MAAATLYGSAFDAGRRSSKRPFQPSSTVATGIRIDAPRSETPNVKVSIAAVSCWPVRRCSLSAPYTWMWREMFLPNSSQIFVNTSSSPRSLIAQLEKLACIPEPFLSLLPSGLGCQSMAYPCFSAVRSNRYRATQVSPPARGRFEISVPCTLTDLVAVCPCLPNRPPRNRRSAVQEKRSWVRTWRLAVEGHGTTLDRIMLPRYLVDHHRRPFAPSPPRPASDPEDRHVNFQRERPFDPDE